jgi:hypothetical protein
MQSIKYSFVLASKLHHSQETRRYGLGDFTLQVCIPASSSDLKLYLAIAIGGGSF